ncbi:hypothetical protein PINS_up003260 [Pythium insidiosum]|nr:hypothetical protein PINS_up003260 [Pythium insidiosum]
MYPMLASPSTTSTASRSTAASLVATAMHMRRAQRLGVDAKSLAVVDEQERCRYPSKFCGNKRAVKSTGRLHRFCEHHRRRANQNQKRWSQMRRAAPQPTTPLGSPSRSLLSPASSCLSSPSSFAVLFIRPHHANRFACHDRLDRPTRGVHKRMEHGPRVVVCGVCCVSSRRVVCLACVSCIPVASCRPGQLEFRGHDVKRERQQQ